MATVDLIARLTAQGEAQFVGALGSADSAISGLGRTAVNSAQSLGRLFTGGIVAGATAFGVALGAGALEGLRFNNSMEQVSAQLMAFLKDGDKVEATLAMIQERAANTPFAFEDMARAVTGLIPAATQASIPIEELIGLAEILAASNPAEGLEGAAFALREAVSGDFTSIIERFNLPRTYINQLREEGVPALEAVQMAMAQLGLDTDLVTNLAQTFEGRWSTVKDTFVGIAAQLTKPIFDVLSSSMGGFLETLNKAKPQIDAFVTGITGAIGGFIANLQEGMTPLNAFIEAIWNIAPRSVLDALVNLRDNIIPAIGEAFSTYIQPIIDFVTENVKLGDVLTAVGIVIAAVVIPAIVSMIAAAAPLILTFAAIVAGVTLVRTAWEENWGGIQEKTAEVGAYLAELFNGTIIPALLVFSAWFTENQETIVTALTAIAAGLATFSILTTIAGWVTALIAAWGALSAGITAAGGIITAIVAVLGGPVTLVIAAVAAAVALLGYAWSQNWGGIQEKTATAIEFVKTTIAAGLAAVQLFWDTHGATIVATATAIWEGIVAAVTTYVEMFKANIATAIATVQTIWSGLQALWEVTSSVFSQIYGIFKDSLALILGVISTALFAITGDMDSAGKAWTEVVEVAGGRIKEGWTAVWNTIKNFTMQVMVAVQSVVNNAMVSLGAAITSGLTAIKTAVSNGWNAVKNLTMTAIVGIANTVKNTDWAGVGLAIAMGIVNGISSGVAMVTEAAANLAQSALDAAKALLGIQSPSRMFYEIGENVTAGFANGVGETASMAVVEVARMSAAALAAAANATPAYTAAGEAAADSFAGGVSGGSGAVGAGMVSLVNGGIRHFYQNNALFDAGQHIINILDEGMKDQIPGLVETAGDAGQAAYDATAGALGINSPSTTFYELGMWTTEGFINGISDTTPDVVGVVMGMGEEVVGAFGSVAPVVMGIGSEIGGGFAEGVSSGFGEWFPTTIEEVARGAADIGAALGEGLLSSAYSVEEAVKQIFDIAGSLSSIGSTISGIYQKNELDPLKAALDGIGQSIGGIDAKGLADALGMTLDDFKAMSIGELNAAGGMGAFGSQSAEAQRYIELLQERLRLEDELAQKTEAMIALEKQQQDLALLKAQQDLLNLIRDNNLSASILDGLELGLDADLGAIMAAMSAAMQEMLAAAQTELGIASPSKEFYRIGQQVTAGLANALWAGEGMISNAMTDLVTVPSMANMSAATMPTFTNSTADPVGGFAAQTINITVKIEGGTTDQRTAAQRGVDEALQAAGINADIRRRM